MSACKQVAMEASASKKVAGRAVYPRTLNPNGAVWNEPFRMHERHKRCGQRAYLLLAKQVKDLAEIRRVRLGTIHCGPDDVEHRVAVFNGCPGMGLQADVATRAHEARL